MAANPSRLRWILIAAVLAALIFMIFPKVHSIFHGSSFDPEDSVTVLVADSYIPAFSVIKAALVRGQEFPKGLVPPGALHTKTELQDENDRPHFISAIAIPAGQPVTHAMVTDTVQGDALGSLIRRGKVAVSFEIDRAHGVGGWIRPGDTIALFGSQAKKTRLLLPSVPVLAVDAQRLGQTPAKSDESGGDSTGAPGTQAPGDSKVVTVLVSPTEASLIIEAREEGSLSAVLRPLGDDFPWTLTN